MTAGSTLNHTVGKLAMRCGSAFGAHKAGRPTLLNKVISALLLGSKVLLKRNKAHSFFCRHDVLFPFSVACLHYKP